MKNNTILFFVFFLVQCSANQVILKQKTSGICWRGPESQYSHVEHYYDFDSLKRNQPYSNYWVLHDKLKRHEKERPFTANKQYIIAEFKEQEIIINLYYNKMDLLYTAHYVYKNDILIKINKNSLGWKFLANIAKDAKGDWVEEKYIYNEQEELIFHIVYSINSEGKTINNVIFEDKEKYNTDYFKEYFKKFHTIYYDYGGHIRCKS